MLEQLLATKPMQDLAAESRNTRLNGALAE
jgi:hypothetical protein